MSRENHYDIIIIGTGAGGGTLAYALARTGKRILILERGDYVPREKENWDPRLVNVEGRYNTKETWRDAKGEELHPHTNYYVGGNTEASLSFYQSALGLRVVGESENYGTEQEHLNNVFGARLRITSLRASGGGPGIEFLEYLAPRDGRMIPKDERANDLTHWQTKLIVRSAESAEQFLLGQKSVFVSTGVVTAKDLGFNKSLLVRDPDGHVMQLIEN